MKFRNRVTDANRDAVFMDELKITIARVLPKLSYVEHELENRMLSLRIHFTDRLTEWERAKLAAILHPALHHGIGSARGWRVEVAEHWNGL